MDVRFRNKMTLVMFFSYRPCVNIVEEPAEDEKWFCPNCPGGGGAPKKKKKKKKKDDH